MSIDDDVTLLSRVPAFSVLGADALRVLAIGADSRTLEEGEVLFREGDKADCGYLVEEGVLMARAHGVGRQPVTFGRGTLIGELSLLAETRRPATVSAAEPSSVMRISRALFLKMLQGYPDVAARLQQTMVARSEQMLQDLGLVRRALDPGEAPAGETKDA